MKLLIISHSCVTPINQQFYAELERQNNWLITIVAPNNWKTEYGKVLSLEPWSDYQGKLVGIPVLLSGNIPLHIYRSTFIRLLKELKPDFIYVHQEPYAIQTAQVYLANSLTINKPIAFFTWQNIYKRYPLIFDQIEKFTLKNSSVAFTGSRSAEEVLRKKGFQGNCIMLPSGINTDIYTDSHEAQTLKETLRKTRSEVIIGYLGRIVVEKGLKTLLQALHKIKELPWQLVMVGTGEYETEFKQIARELQINHKINYLGYVPHTKAPLYLSAFDLLVLPSETQPNWKEQFGRVIIESMACGTPVIGSNSGEIPYLIEATGGGLTFPEAQPEALARQLSKLVEDRDLRSDLGQKGHQAVVENYTNSTLVRGFAATIEKVVEAEKK
ncbi:MAG TPA: glycosyltransferase [Coleofasciculaceae cyanobacterium]|jgi:glycosyltransferase involved in cell wall biosynthesis